MEAFKLELFQREHGRAFPPYRSLTSVEAEQLRAALSRKHGLSRTGFEDELAAKQTFDSRTDATEKFDLLSTLHGLLIRVLPEIFINWHRFEQIDTLAATDVSKYFADIWFPAADDIDLFDASAEWILSIRHDGVIHFVVAPPHEPTPS